MDRKAHWENIYRAKQPDAMSWYRPRLERSLELIASTGLDNNTRVIDVGGDASVLVDDLLARGFTRLTVLDIAGEAMRRSAARLGVRAGEIRWIEADVTHAVLPTAGFDLWHDRAVFHFLTDPDDRRRYRDVAVSAITPGGYAILATFGPNGPLTCSGLDVVRYDTDGLQRELEPAFELRCSFVEEHRTPAGKAQEFLYALFRKRPH